MTILSRAKVCLSQNGVVNTLAQSAFIIGTCFCKVKLSHRYISHDKCTDTDMEETAIDLVWLPQMPWGILVSAQFWLFNLATYRECVY